jgi:F-type H+-transporting ATPase subunit gamma
LPAAKLRGAQEKMESFRPYTAKFNEAMSNLSGGANTNAFPLMENRQIKTVELVVVTSDRGLCGSFNANIVKLVNKKIAGYEAEGRGVSLVCVGKKAINC